MATPSDDRRSLSIDERESMARPREGEEATILPTYRNGELRQIDNLRHKFSLLTGKQKNIVVCH